MRAWIVEEEKGESSLRDDVSEADLPEGEVTIAVEHSTLNYKDALALLGRAKIVRKHPMVLGIDLAGRVLEDRSGTLAPGTPVVVNGHGQSETRWGGYAEKARVPVEWALPLPERFDTADAMAIGTAGYTAALCVNALLDAGLTPDDGDVLVTGATGGVGSVALSLLARKGFRVLAATGRESERPYLEGLGAADLVPRAELEGKVRPLDEQRWAGAVDVVGSTVLAKVLSHTRYGGKVAATGLAGGMDLPAFVTPFILRAVTLLGVESVQTPRPKRERAWALLAEHLDDASLRSMRSRIPLADVKEAAAKLLANELKGRVVVDL